MQLPRVVKINSRRRENKHRRKLEIVVDMLSVAIEKAKKTRIMYQANLSYRLVEKYLRHLLGSGLVELDDDSFYQITFKGKEFLQLYADYVERCRRVDEEISGVKKDVLLLEDMCFNNESNLKRVTNSKQVLV